MQAVFCNLPWNWWIRSQETTTFVTFVVNFHYVLSWLWVCLIAKIREFPGASPLDPQGVRLVPHDARPFLRISVSGYFHPWEQLMMWTHSNWLTKENLSFFSFFYYSFVTFLNIFLHVQVAVMNLISRRNRANWSTCTLLVFFSVYSCVGKCLWYVLAVLIFADGTESASSFTPTFFVTP